MSIATNTSPVGHVLGAVLFDKLARDRLHAYNQNGFSEWKKSIFFNSTNKGVRDIHDYLDSLEEKRSTLIQTANEESEIISDTAQVIELFYVTSTKLRECL